VNGAELGWRASRRKRIEAAAIAAAGHPIISLLGRTWRWRVEGLEHFERLVSSRRFPVMAFWHGRILPALYYFRRRGIVVITSDNFDGEWMAGIIHRFGYTTARGSTSRHAARAALRAKRRLEEGYPVGVTLDGPRGPARVAQPGAVWLAKVTGSPVLPFHLEAASHWTAPSWDATQVPWPFTRIAIAIGEPFWVPPGADAQGLEASRLELERVLGTLETRALELLAG
jgi:lysophospholipid acyltransferase (LPLAT)-like uncharacterized protein